ncbi:MAG TPA: hypothetical protein VGB51_05540 [Actinomycetota bacterium]
MTRRALLLVPLLALLLSPGTRATGAASTEVRFTVREARAYLYRVALRKEVIEAAQNAEPCDPKEDPYHCDDVAYNHRPNCPEPIALEAKGRGARPAPAPGAEPEEGSAGDGAGPESEPPLSSAVTLNEFLVLARLGKVGTVVEAAGMASDSFVDLSGRQEPELHTESNAFAPNVRDLEERCLEEEEGSGSYKHFLSRSFHRPSTYHLAECFQDDCTFDRATFFAQAREGRTIVSLSKRGDRVTGSLSATFQELSWGEGAVTVDQLHTFITFTSDGTAEGLAWKVDTTAKGLRLGGEPVALPGGDLVGTEALQVGVAAPYVRAPEEGDALRIVAPGLVIASREQTVYLAGAELDASMDRGEPFSSPGGTGEGSGGQSGTDPATGSVTATEAPPVDDAAATPGEIPAGDEVASNDTAGPQAIVSVERIRTGLLPVLGILLAGALGVLLILHHWLRRFPLIRGAYRAGPLHALDRLLRAFVRS